MHYHVSNFLLTATFGASLLANIFASLALNEKKWLVSLGAPDKGINDSNYEQFFRFGYGAQIAGTCLIFVVTIISIFHDSFAQRWWSIYVIIFFGIISLILTGLVLMTGSVVRFMSENNMDTLKHIKNITEIAHNKILPTKAPSKKIDINNLINNMTIYEFSIFTSYSVHHFMITFFCSVMVIGMIFFSLGYMANETSTYTVHEDEEENYSESNEQVVINDKQNMTLSRDAFKARQKTKELVPSGTPQPFNAEKRYNAMMLKS